VQLEEQLQISEKMASIGLLAAGVAHEVNTPLTGISSFTQMLLENADPDDPRTRCWRRSSGRRSGPRRSSTGC
jgi:two-component system, NtrC family, sensor kinase